LKNERFILAVTIAGVLAIYTALVFAFFSSEGESRQFYMFLLGMPFAMVLVIFPRATLIVLALGAYSFRWLYDTVHALPREATWMVDILIMVLVARALLMMPAQKERIGGVIKYVFVLIAFAVLSTIINRNGQVTFLAGMRIGFRYVLLFVAAANMNVSIKWLRNYILFLFAIAAVQLPVIVSQFQDIGWTDLDRMSGTFGYGETPGIGLFLLILDAYLLSKMIEESKFRLSYVVIIFALSTMPIFGEVKFYFLFLPVLLVFLVRNEVLRRPAVAALVVVAGLSVVLAANFFVVKSGAWVSGNNPLTLVTKLPEKFNEEVQKGEQYGYNERGYQYVSSIRLAAASWRTVIFGNGPGSITDSYISENHSSKLAYYSQWGLTSLRALSIVWLLIEYGYVGVAMILFLIYWIYRRGAYLRKSQDLETRVLGRLLECLALLYGVWQFYESAWQADAMSFSFWPLAGLLVGLSYREEARQRAQALADIRTAALQSATA
jgi:hypothetical protein